MEFCIFHFMYFLLHVFAFRSKKSKMLNAGLLLVTECFHIDVTSALSFFFFNDFFHYFEEKKGRETTT